MRELLRTKGFKITPQRELILNSFLELGEHVSVDELYRKVAEKDSSIGYSTVWRNLKMICEVGLAEEVNIGDGVTRYDRVTDAPHGHLYCRECKEFIEFNAEHVVGDLNRLIRRKGFVAEGYKIEVQGLCRKCASKRGKGAARKSSGKKH